MRGLLWVGALGLLAAGCGEESHGTGGEDAGGFDAHVVEIDAGFDAGPDGGRRDTGPICPGDPRCDCPAAQINCGGTCVDPMTSEAHCGDCDTACAGGDTCRDGACAFVCTAPNLECDDGAGGVVCADVRTDEANCGGCGMACGPGAVCNAGRCACPTGTALCSGGACADLMTDVANCGGCGNDCGAGGSCSGGRCTCGTGRMECRRRCIDVSSDPDNCGGCFLTCGSTEECAGGACRCAPGYTNCGRGCIDLMRDAGNCGRCGVTCGEGGVCTAGACTCAPGLTMCGPSCLDLANSSTDCGTCGHVCPGTETCFAGVCGCPPGQTSCGGICRATMTDRANCGACGRACPGTESCVAGVCGCTGGQTSCSGTCRDLRSDRANCGACGMACPGGFICLSSRCTDAPPTRYMQTTATAAEAPWIDACAQPGHTEYLGGLDDSSMLVPLGIPFRYWATDLPAGSMINISTNGFMSLEAMLNGSLSGTVPSTTTPNAVIAGHWGDDYTRGPICVATVGTAPTRQFVVEWNDTYYCCGGAGGGVHNTFEVVLDEGSGTIDIIYLTMDMARAQTSGIEDQTGMQGINACPGGVGSCIPAAGERYRFVPIP